MALQTKIIACGKTLAAISMVLKFFVGPLLLLQHLQLLVFVELFLK
jgi:hypothetical protein